MDPQSSDIRKPWIISRFPITGNTVALNEAHDIARQELLRLLLEDERLRDLVARCLEDTGVKTYLQIIEALYEELAQTLAFDSVESFHRWHQVSGRKDFEAWTERCTDWQSRGKNHPDGLIGAVAIVIEKYSTTAIERGFVRLLEHRTAEFVRDTLQLPWRWVAIDLVDYSLCSIQFLVLGIPFRRQAYTEDLTPSPEFSLALSRSRGETVADAYKRINEFEGEVKQLAARLNSMMLPRGDPRQPDVTERYVNWYFRSHITGESIRKIAANPGDGIKRERKDIRFGIAEAIKLLDLDPRSWGDTHESDIFGSSQEQTDESETSPREGVLELNDEQWAAILPHIPVPERRVGGRGRPRQDDREILNGILWVLRTGVVWARMPKRYPPYQTCHRRFQEWVKEGAFERILLALPHEIRSEIEGL